MLGRFSLRHRQPAQRVGAADAAPGEDGRAHQAPPSRPGSGRPGLQRSAGIDLVRVVGLVAVVGGHVFGSDPLVHELTYSWHVPVFFFLTGYLWNPRRSLGGEGRARLRSLMLPYVVWVTLLAGLYELQAAVSSGSARPGRLTGVLLGGANAGGPFFFTIWFVSALFFVALLFRALGRLPVWAQWAAAAAGILAGRLFPSALSHSPLAVGVALPCLVFVLAGSTLRSVRDRIRRPGRIGLLGLGASAAAVLLKIAEPLDLKHLDLGTPILSVAVSITISASLVLIAEPLMHRAPARLGRMTTMLALGSLTVVFLHPLLMSLFPAPPGLRWVQLLIVLLVPWLIGTAAAYTPAGRWLNGIRLQTAAPRERAA